jgi:hypothetical protein
MKKATVIAFVLGWLVAFFLSPRDVWGMVGGKK